ncbi:MAG: glycosyltransferase family 4 protein [Bacteroidales bacterium]
MKILFLTRWYLPFSGIFVERHAKAVALYNDLVVLAVLPGEHSSSLKPVIEEQPGQSGFTVVRYFYRPSRCRIAMIAGLINLLKFFVCSVSGYRFVAKQYGSFDLIHVHILTRTAVPAFLVKLLTGKPYIISEHWTRYIPENWGFTNIFRRILTRLFVRHAAAVTTVSDFLRTAILDCGLRNEKFVIIPNAIDTVRFSPAGNRPAILKKKILHVSTLHERAKNIHGILRVISILAEQRSDFEVLFIGGEEPALGKARMYASELGLEIPNVIFKGPVQPGELAEIYRESSFLLMFSNFESFSVVIPEALSSGIPVLATSVGGIPEYFNNKAGRLTSPGNEPELLNNLNFMLDHFQSFDPEYLSSFIEQRFGLQRVGKQFDDLYRSVLKKAVNKSC